MRKDRGGSNPLRQMMRHAFRHAPRIDEYESGAMGKNQFGNTIVDFSPHLRGGDGPEFLARNFDGNIESASMATVHNPDIPVRLCKSCYFIQGSNGCRQADPLRRRSTSLSDQAVEPRRRQREMRATLVVDDGVDFVKDEGACGGKSGSSLLGSQEDVERLRSRDQNMRGTASHFLPIRGIG